MLKRSLAAVLTFLNISQAEEGIQNSRELVFSNFYKFSFWGENDWGEAHSGYGSTLAATVDYREFLQLFLETYNIQSVVDLGCGDWEFSKAINWKDIEYTGIDIVPFLIGKNQFKYGSSKIKFVHQDAVSSNLPSSDLLICKDVLQHLPNEDIQSIIKQFRKYKYCLITNDIFSALGPSSSTVNCQIKVGEWRPVDLTQAPFFLHGEKILTFSNEADTKQVLLIVN